MLENIKIILENAAILSLQLVTPVMLLVQITKYSLELDEKKNKKHKRWIPAISLFWGFFISFLVSSYQFDLLAFFVALFSATGACGLYDIAGKMIINKK